MTSVIFGVVVVGNAVAKNLATEPSIDDVVAVLVCSDRPTCRLRLRALSNQLAKTIEQ